MIFKSDLVNDKADAYSPPQFQLFVPYSIMKLNLYISLYCTRILSHNVSKNDFMTLNNLIRIPM